MHISYDKKHVCKNRSNIGSVLTSYLLGSLHSLRCFVYSTLDRYRLLRGLLYHEELEYMAINLSTIVSFACKQQSILHTNASFYPRTQLNVYTVKIEKEKNPRTIERYVV